MKPVRNKVLVLLLVSLLLVACDKKDKEEVKSQPKPEPPKQEVKLDVSMLELVPEDTIFFSGGLEPFPLKETLQWSAAQFSMLKELDPKTMLPPVQETAPEGQRMAAQLWAEYYALLVSPETELTAWGIKEKPVMASYSIGLSPVLLRISLQDAEKFNAKLDGLEADAKITGKSETLGEATFRRYVLQEKDPHLTLIIGVDGERNHAVVLLDLGVDSDQTLALALGQKKPEKSLAQSGRVEALQKKYQLLPSWISYIDHQQLITGLTTKEGNSLAKMVQVLAPQLQGATESLAALQEEGCRNDLTAIGENWPQTVIGYTALDLKAKPSHIDSLMVVESKDKKLLDGLGSLRGVVPDYVRNSPEPPVFSFGLGLNLDNLMPFLTQRWTEITQKQYSCSFLQEMQAQVKTQQPAVIGAATGMAPGVQGIAFSLLSLTMSSPENSGMPMPEKADAVISLAAKDPATLVQMASTMVPPLAELQLPADGTPVQLPLPLPLQFPVMAAIHGQHLTVYAGEKAAGIAQGLDKVSLDASRGFMAADIDYGKYYGLIGDVMTDFGVTADSPENAQATAILEGMKKAAMRLWMDMDFTERGIEMHANVISTK
ncbi:MAG: hypothetical protein ACL93V_01340 [Candidatus Electrothrix sp. YB6]